MESAKVSKASNTARKAARSVPPVARSSSSITHDASRGLPHGTVKKQRRRQPGLSRVQKEKIDRAFVLYQRAVRDHKARGGSSKLPVPFDYIAHSHMWAVYAASVDQVKQYWKRHAARVAKLCSEAADGA